MYLGFDVEDATKHVKNTNVYYTAQQTHTSDDEEVGEANKAF